MTWDKLKREKITAVINDGISINISKQRPGSRGWPQVNVRYSKAIAEVLGSPRGNRVMVFIGTEEDTGWLMLRGVGINDENSFKPIQSSSAWYIRFSARHLGFVPRTFWMPSVRIPLDEVMLHVGSFGCSFKMPLLLTNAAMAELEEVAGDIR